MNDQNEMMMEEIARLKAELQRVQAANVAERRAGTIRLGEGLSARVTEKGGLSVYGLGRWPATFYRGQWLRLLSVAAEICKAIHDNQDILTDPPAK